MITSLQSIDDVLVELDHIIDHSVKKNTIYGLFAFVYRRTTQKIKEGLNNKRFENPRRMEIFDIKFAKRYIDAFWKYDRGEQPTRSWLVSFEPDNKDVCLLQHVLLGMNAHIQLDLCIVAADIAPGDSIFEIESDFMTVNDLLTELIDEMQARLSRVSRFMVLFDWVGGRKDEILIDLGIRRSRSTAWQNAQELAFLEGPDREVFIEHLDRDIAALSEKLINPDSRLLKNCFWCIHRFEERNVAKIIERMR